MSSLFWDALHRLQTRLPMKRRQQYDEFLEFYGIKEGDGMYLAPEDRVNIW